MDSKSPMESKDPEAVLGTTTSLSSDKTKNMQDGVVYTIDAKAERALVWKFDLRLMPLLALMYLVCHDVDPDVKQT